MNMKVHQTLVCLNLLSFRTKDLAEPTIGIQSESAANHNTLLRHTSAPTVPAAWDLATLSVHHTQKTHHTPANGWGGKWRGEDGGGWG
jgi:hypothetical protein